MVTPNTATEMANKLALRSVTRGGANTWFEAIDPAIMVNAAATTNGLVGLSVPTNNTTFQVGITSAIASGVFAVTAITGAGSGSFPYTITLTGSSASAFSTGSTFNVAGVTTTTGYNQAYVISSVTYSGASSGATTFTASGTTSNVVTGAATLTNAWVSGTGYGTLTTTLTGTSTGNNVAALVSGLAAGPLSGYTFYANAGNANYLYNTTTTLVIPSGAALGVVNALGTAPVLTSLALSGTNAEATTYPNYTGTPNAVPTWVDDATVHATQVGFNGLAVAATTLSGTGLVTQQQVRQIQTNVSETQTYAGYQATYSGNLYQTGQKRTYRQQS